MKLRRFERVSCGIMSTIIYLGWLAAVYNYYNWPAGSLYCVIFVCAAIGLPLIAIAGCAGVYGHGLVWLAAVTSLWPTIIALGIAIFSLAGAYEETALISICWWYLGMLFADSISSFALWKIFGGNRSSHSQPRNM